MAETHIPKDRSARIGFRQSGVAEINRLIEQEGEQVIRAHNYAWSDYEKACVAEGLTLMGENFTLGDVDASLLENNPEFSGLSRELCVHPFSLAEVFLKGMGLYSSYWRQGKNLGRYGDPFGLVETRELMGDFFTKWTGIRLETKHTFFSSEGGSGMADKALKVLKRQLQDKGVTKPTLLVSTPNYSPISTMADLQGWNCLKEPCSEQNNYFFEPDQAAQLALQADAAYIVPINNPTSVMINPEQLKQSVQAMQKANPEMTFLVDLAYITTIDKSTAHQLMEVFTDPDVLSKTVFITSLSKSHAMPGLRFGGAHTSIKDFDKHLRSLSSQTNPSVPVIASLAAYGALTHVTEATMIRTAQVYKTHREAMLDSLFQINMNAGIEIFRDPRNLKADGALYVYPQLNGQQAFDLFISSGLLGMGGHYFLDQEENCRVRFAVAALSLEQIQSIPDKFDYSTN